MSAKAEEVPPADTMPVAAAVPISWSRIVTTFATTAVDDLPLKIWALLWRKQEVIDKYQVWKEQTATTFDCTTSSILCEKLGYNAAVCGTTGKYKAVRPKMSDAGSGTPVAGSPYAVDDGKGGDPFLVALHPNTFPYNVEKDVRHDVLWSEKPLDHTTIKAQLSALLGTRQCLWYENDPSRKSLPLVWHVHVFSEEVPRCSDSDE